MDKNVILDWKLLVILAPSLVMFMEIFVVRSPNISVSDINRTEPKNNRKPNGLDIQKPNGSVFGSVLSNNRTEPRFAHP